MPDLRIEKIVGGGEGLAHADGRPIFVGHVLPGEEVEVRITQRKAKYLRAEPVRIAKPAAERTEPLCPYHFRPGGEGPFCGGCSWQQMRYTSQLHWKREIVQEALERIGGFRPDAAGGLRGRPVWPSERPFGSRHKAEFALRQKNGKPIIGFFAPGTHEVVDVERCAVSPDPVNMALAAFREAVEKYRPPLYDEKKHTGSLRHFLVRATSEGDVLAGWVSRTEEVPREKEMVEHLIGNVPGLRGIFRNHNPAKTNVILNRKPGATTPLWGTQRLSQTVKGRKFEYSAFSFFQVDPLLAETLVDVAARYALAEPAPEILADLYAGVGLFGICLAERFRRVEMAEENPAAAEEAQRNIRANLLAEKVRQHCGTVESFLKSFRPEGEWTAIVDPPRAGLSEEGLRHLARRAPRRIVYVSCDPATMSRDLAKLAGSGGTYRLVEVQPVDLFPQTPHVECVAHLERREAT